MSEKLTRARIEQATKEALKGINKDFICHNKAALKAMYYAGQQRLDKEFLTEAMRRKLQKLVEVKRGK